jgi:hypothetical protein
MKFHLTKITSNINCGGSKSPEAAPANNTVIWHLF